MASKRTLRPSRSSGNRRLQKKRRARNPTARGQCGRRQPVRAILPAPARHELLVHCDRIRRSARRDAPSDPSAAPIGRKPAIASSATQQVSLLSWYHRAQLSYDSAKRYVF